MISRALQDESRAIRLPVHMQEPWIKIRNASAKLFQELEREPTHDEIAEQAELPRATVNMILKIIRTPMSLSKPIGEGEDEFGALLEDKHTHGVHDSDGEQRLHESLMQALKTLSLREQEILKMRYGLLDGYFYTLEEAGKVFHVTRERIRQIEAKAMRKLEGPNRAGILLPFIDQKEESAE